MRRICLAILLASLWLPVSSYATDNQPAETVVAVGSVKNGPALSKIKEISREIDRLIQKNLEAKGLKPNPTVGDEIFLRRVYLDIAGRIPGYQETIEFLDDQSPGKRQKLIDKLLDSEGFVSHQFNFFADLLRLKSRLRNIPGEPYIDFVKDSIRENKPYDQFVRELLTANGSYAERGNGAVGYYMRDFGMPEDNMSNTIRIFLGTRLECAQCHDHPFDVWTQRDYFEMVAFTGGVLMRVDAPFEGANKLRQMTRKGELDEKTRRNLQNILRPLTYGVKGSGTGLALLPDDYQEDDGKPNELVTAKTMFEKKSLVVPKLPQIKDRKGRRRPGRRRNQIRGAQEVNSREAYASWMTGRDNPRFATVIANRMWKRAMGVGLIEPVDIITDETVPSNPELMEYLTQQMKEMDFDLKQFLRAIYNTNAYHRQACVSDAEESTEYSFRGPLLRRLSAEQLWDSLVTLAIEDVDTRGGYKQLNRRYLGMSLEQIFEKTKTMSAEEVLKLAEKDPRKMRNKQYEKMRAQQNSVRNKYKAKLGELRKKQKLASRERDFQQMKMLRGEQKDLMMEMGRETNKAARDMIRASEMSSPARPGHLVREFGQSDRDQIDNANREPAVTQVLSLMNGFIEKRIAANRYTELMKNVEQAESVDEKIDVVFLSILNRKPTAEERQLWLDDASAHGPEVAADLIWTLVNNNEFLFVQ